MNTVLFVMSGMSFRMVLCLRYKLTEGNHYDKHCGCRCLLVFLLYTVCVVLCVYSRLFAAGSCVCFPSICWGLCLEQQKRWQPVQRSVTLSYIIWLQSTELEFSGPVISILTGDWPVSSHVQSCPSVVTQEHHIWTIPLCCWSKQPKYAGL